MKETDHLRTQMNEIIEKIDNESQRERANETAHKMRIMYDAMIDNGFNEEQAWYVVTAVLRACLNSD